MFDYLRFVPKLDLEKPTDPSNYRNIPLGGDAFIKGCPMNWQDDITGRVSSAIMSYLKGDPDANELAIVIKFIQHHIHATCWLETAPHSEVIDDEFSNEIRILREKSLQLKTLGDVRKYMSQAMDIGLDPL